MELINQGKTKDVYRLGNGNLELRFKDDMTGKDGVFDPGENQVGLKLEGAGHAALSLTKFFFETFRRRDIPTHYISADLENNTMEVKEAKSFGQGLEFICRYRAVGSFYRRFKSIVEEGAELDGLVEFTIKDDEAKDPPANKDTLIMLGVLTEEEFEALKASTREISDLIKEILAEKGLELYDIKLEFAKDSEGNIMLIDEVSAGNMRVYRGEEKLGPLELTELVLG